MDDKSFSTMMDALQSAGYRITHQRKLICRMLAESEEHPSAQMIFDTLKQEDGTISLATVYNTLDALARLGVINVLGEVGDADSVRYDADTGPHINLACVRCARIIDLPSQHVQELDEEIQQNSGYALLGARVLYYGICPNCQAKEQAASPSQSASDPASTASRG